MQWTSAPNIGEAPLPQRARGYWKTWVSADGEGLEKLLEAERAELPPWFVVGFGSGIAAWFALDTAVEWRAFPCVAVALSLAGFAIGRGREGRALGWFALVVVLGCSLAGALRMGCKAAARVSGRRQRSRKVEAIDHLAARDKVRLLIRPDAGDGRHLAVIFRKAP
jgi:competence protein ComEC